MTIFKFKYIYVYICLILISFNSFAQEKESVCGTEMSNKKAVKLFEKGTDRKNKFEDRVNYLKECLALEPEYPEALNAYIEAQMKFHRADGTSFKPIEENIIKLIALCPEGFPYVYFYMGEYYYGQEKFAEAIPNLKKFLKSGDKIKADKDYNAAEGMLEDAEFYDKLMGHPVNFKPKVVTGVSSKDNEYLAIISPDNELCLYTRNVSVKSKDDFMSRDNTQKEVFAYSKRASADAQFDNGTLFDFPFNQGNDAYGGACLSADNKKMYITICKPGKGGYVNCDIYEATNIDDDWEFLKPLGPEINTEDGWESQPTLSSDGNMLIFASARADSKKIDLYFSKKNSDGNWSKAENIGPTINTNGSEKTPFLHSDSHTLYFSSDGNRGVGGFDIYYSKLDDNGKWSKPKNIGYPINSEEDEYGFFVSLDGHLGYYASSKFASIGKGGIDVFNFEMPAEAKPHKVLFFRGTVTDGEGQGAINGKIEVKDLKTNQVTSIPVSGKDGKYAGFVTVKPGHDMVLTVKKDNGVPTSTFISSKDTALCGKPIQKDFESPELKVGGIYRLDHINYKTNSSELTDDSFHILDELILFLNEKPDIHIAIHGHTDDVGAPDANLALSTDRAYSVLDYLERKGVDKTRLTFKGFGSTKPLVANDTKENKAKNRRTEFVIVKL